MKRPKSLRHEIKWTAFEKKNSWRPNPRLPEEAEKMFEYLAEQTGRSVHDLLREAVNQYLNIGYHSGDHVVTSSPTERVIQEPKPKLTDASFAGCEEPTNNPELSEPDSVCFWLSASQDAQ
jgi:predicted DNA-binding protein